MRSRCIIWPGCHGEPKKPYGIINFSRTKRFMAHRVIYEGIHGKIPAGLVIDHICRNHRCVNIKHLRVVTNRENILCGIGPTAMNARKKLCLRGHVLKVRKSVPNWRICQICKNTKTLECKRRLAQAIRQRSSNE